MTCRERVASDAAAPDRAAAMRRSEGLMAAADVRCTATSTAARVIEAASASAATTAAIATAAASAMKTASAVSSPSSSMTTAASMAAPSSASIGDTTQVNEG
jgi:hypothetical protein